MTDIDQGIDGFIGQDAYDTNGNKIGKIEAVYEDEATHRPEWVTVKTGWFGSHVSFVPLQGAERQDRDLIVAWDKDTVKDAPHLDPTQHLSEEEEAQLYRYYGF